jgi:hypothetical protein
MIRPLLLAVLLFALLQPAFAEPPRNRITDNKVFVQIRVKPTDAFDGNTGCTCFSPKGTSVPDASLTCGHPGAVSEVSWKYVKTTENGDVYKFTRRFPADAEAPKEETKEVVFQGKKVIVFEDQWHRIGMAPSEKK